MERLDIYAALRRSTVPAAMAAARLAFTPSTHSRVTKIVIDDTQTHPTTDQSIAYQQTSGPAFGECDPDD